MKARRLRYVWTGDGPGPQRGSLLIAFSKRTNRPTGTRYRVLRIVSVLGDPRRTVYSLVVARLFEDNPRQHRGVFDLRWF